MQKRYDNQYKYFYNDDKGQRRTYGIYAPGIDRFLHIDNSDFWISMDTANILSSKIPTLTYVLPTETYGINNQNCLTYCIFNKTDQRVGNSTILVARQHPMFKFLYSEDTLVNAGIPEDYKESQDSLIQIKRYVDYVYQQCMAINISEIFYNPFNSKGFINTYMPDGWGEEINSKEFDRTKLQKGIFANLRSILYQSNTPEEADAKIIDLWNNNYYDVGYLIDGYYKILGIPLPKQLKDKSGLKANTNSSTYIF